MESKSSLNRSIEGASKHYSSLFSLPSLKTVLLALATTCVITGLFTLVVPHSLGLTSALFFGFSLFALTLIADLTLTRLVLRKDPIYTLRRTLTLSLVSWGIWLIFIIIGAVLSSPFGLLLWVKFCLLGYAVVITLRAVVFMCRRLDSPRRCRPP